MKDGRVLNWNVQSDDPLCTLQEAFEKVNPRLGFNVELKFDDNLVYQEEELSHILEAILKACFAYLTLSNCVQHTCLTLSFAPWKQVVFEYAKDRPIIFSSFQPDAAQLMRKMQSTYPVSTLLPDTLQIPLELLSLP
jgi:glycerophosphoryl diester phosphodiesterase